MKGQRTTLVFNRTRIVMTTLLQNGREHDNPATAVDPDVVVKTKTGYDVQEGDVLLLPFLMTISISYY